MKRLEYFLTITAPILLTLITCGITLFAEQPERVGVAFLYLGGLFGSIWLIGLMILLVLEKYVKIIEEQRARDITRLFK
ncbi:hypothetical protein P7F88_10335 [Vibrio hannami]|uniref:hypothetical protein n=1 Tax=Vibrio hannami TaxID=2717094 RepID=UPI00240F7EE2|nr:hypothetical protein [Vibrio hannami]MDG3086488.1 hypothetical protein [Vibrio hannami]